MTRRRSARSSSALQAIVFDFDGLVIDTESAEYESINAVFSDHGEELSLELWSSFIGTVEHPHWTEILEGQLGRPVDRDQLVAARRATNRAILDELPINPGVVELFDEAGDAGVRLAMASSSPRTWVEGHLHDRALLDRFEHIVCGDDVERTKPDPALYRLATRLLGVEAERTVAVEDSVNGCLAAVAAGLRVVAVPGPLTRGMDFSVATRVVGSLAEISLGDLEGLVAT